MNASQSIRANKQLNFLFSVLFLNTIIESFLQYFNDRTVIITAQLFINGAYFAYYLLSTKHIKKPPFIRTVTFLLVFLVLCSLFSSDPIITFNYLLKFVIPYFFYIIGFNVVSSSKAFNELVGKLWLFTAYFAVYIVIVNTFTIGTSLYPGGLKVGYYSLNGLYVPTFSILLIIFYYRSIPTKRQRILGIFFSIICVIILIILLKRTLILILLVGLFFYFIKTFSLKRIISTAVFVSVLVVAGYFFRGSFIESLESRSSRFDKEYELTQEGRFTEIFFIYDYMTEKPMSLVWGTGEPFNDRKTVSKIYGADREAHNSFIRLFWSAGVIGLSLFIIFNYQQIKLSRIYYLRAKKSANILASNFYFFLIVFVVIRFINEFSSGITYLGYNALSYVFIAGAFRIFGEFVRTKEHLNSIDTHLQDKL